MKAKLATALKYILFFLAGLAILYYLFNTYYTPAFVHDFKSIKYHWLALSMLCALVAHVARALRWQLMIDPLVNKKTTFLNVFNALMLGYLVNLGLPRLGELARCAWLAKKENINTVKLIGSVIAERLLDLLMLFLLLIGAIITYSDLITKLLEVNNAYAFVNDKLPYIILALSIGIILVAIAIFLFTKNHALTGKLKTLLLKLSDGFFSIKKVKNRGGFIFYTLLIWLLYIASTYFGFKMLNQTNLLTYADAMLTVVAGSFGMVAPIQGGIGAYHFMVSKCLILLGISGSAALVFATVSHASQTILAAILGFCALLPAPKRIRQDT